MEKSSKVTELIRKTGDLTVVRAVRDGMVHIVPVLIIGSFSLILQTFPVAYGFTLLGLVPRITSEVAWTTPILLGGFSTTGSVMGSLLQLVNVILGVGIYTPFVRILDRQALHELGCDCYQGYLYSPAVFLSQK